MTLRSCLLFMLIVLMSCDLDKHDNAPEGFDPPHASLHIDPGMGDTTTLFTLSASGSYDADHIKQLLEYRWDFNNDSIWDTDYSDYPYFIKLFEEPGKHEVKVEVTDRYGQKSVATRSLRTWGAETDTSSFIDPRDGQVYKTVKLFDVEWMAENLNYGTLLPVHDSTVDDGIVHKYCYKDDQNSRWDIGGTLTYYDWIEAMNYDTVSAQGICPPGWELPTSDDWRSIIESHKGLILYYSEYGFSNLNLTRIGIQPRLQDWEIIDSSLFTSYWLYLTRDYVKDFWDGNDHVTPIVVSSLQPKYRDNIFSMRFTNDVIRKYMGIAPIRCIKRDKQ